MHNPILPPQNLHISDLNENTAQDKLRPITLVDETSVPCIWDSYCLNNQASFHRSEQVCKVTWHFILKNIFHNSIPYLLNKIFWNSFACYQIKFLLLAEKIVVNLFPHFCLYKELSFSLNTLYYYYCMYSVFVE